MGIELTNPQFWYAFCGLVLFIGAWLALNLRESPTGRALRALHGSEVAARTAGIDIAKAKLNAFVISARLRLRRRLPAGVAEPAHHA